MGIFGEFSYASKLADIENLINKWGMGNNIYMMKIFYLLLEVFDFIIALAQKYQFFAKGPLHWGYRFGFYGPYILNLCT